MEPQAAIALIETDLRALVRSVLTDEQWRSALGGGKTEDLQKRQSEEAKRRSPAVVPSDLLQYTHFYELRQIIVAKWDQFAAALGKKRDFEVWADQIEDFRNAPAHSRELLPFERSLLEGIAGAVRTRVTMFRSSQDSDMSYYPVIESVTDSFGHRLEQISTDGVTAAQFTTTVRLRPGQEVTFQARGWDPQGRELTWGLAAGNRHLESVVGNEVDVTWTVGESDVARYCHIYLSLTSSGKYHRYTSLDHQVVFRYQVDPPEET